MNPLPRDYPISDRAKNIAFVGAHGLLGGNKDGIGSPDRGFIDLLSNARLVAVGNRGNMRSLPQVAAVENRRLGIGRRNHNIGEFQRFFRV